MSEGVLGLFGVALGAALLDFLLPGKESSGVRSAVRFLTALAVLCLLLSPFLSMLGSVGEALEGEIAFEEEADRAAFEECFADTVNARGLAEGERLLLAYLEEEFDVGQENCEISLELGEEGTLSCVRVFFSGTALLKDPDEIARALEDKLNCRVEVR